MSDLAELAAALSEFQAEMPTVAKSKKANVPTKNGGSYSYTYAGLADVTETAMPILTKHGLSFTCLPRRTDSGHELVGLLLHKSGQSVEGALPIRGGSAQEMGGWLTYARRYLFGAMTGIVTEEDDDGHLAQQGSKGKSQPQQQAPSGQKRTMSRKPRQEPTPEKPDRPAPMTDRTRKHMFALMADQGINDRDEQIRGIAHVIGHPIESRGDLTEDEAQAVVLQLESRKATTQDPPADEQALWEGEGK